MTSSRSTLRSGSGCAVGSTPVARVESVDVGGVVEHGGQLAGEGLELVGAQRQPGEAGDVGHVGGRDAVGHTGHGRAGLRVDRPVGYGRPDLIDDVRGGRPTWCIPS
jgi:hypothetical protein